MLRDCMNSEAWTEMELFEGVDLNDSFVLGWRQDRDLLEFSLEASLWPGHPEYEAPPHDEYACYKPAALRVRGLRSVTGLRGMHECMPAIDAAGERDFGNIDALSALPSGGFHLAGEFGEVRIEGGQLEFEVLQHNPPLEPTG